LATYQYNGLVRPGILACDIVMDEKLPSLEKNGFIIADFRPDNVIIKFYAWKPPEPIEAIDNLQAHHVINLKIPK